ncbi:uncharacterized protein JCM10292_001778 [Rhodotorula paludigena]|uniref:uncharacterized protein n=1 Tax=Rhodotorula paludigena TaxID=86838 RepID=UPI003176E66D
MAAVALSGIYALLRSGERFADLRSPVIPRPPVDDSDGTLSPDSAASPASSAPSSPPRSRRSSRAGLAPPPLTERGLRAHHLAWLIRLRDLRGRYVALADAKSKGHESCWAGKATRRHLRAVRKASEEAEWVEEHLRQAVLWCRQAGVSKAPVKRLLAVGKQGIAARPKHSTFPPSLLELPFPLPTAYEANIYFLTVPRPPPLARHEQFDPERVAQSSEAPPLYSPEAGFGEVVLEGAEALEDATELLEYERTSRALQSEASASVELFANVEETLDN